MCLQLIDPLLDRIVGELAIHAEGSLATKEDGCDRRFGGHIEFMGAEVSIIPAASGVVGSLAKAVVRGDILYTDVLKADRGSRDGGANLASCNDIARFATHPLAFVLHLPDAAIYICFVDAEVVVFAHRSQGGADKDIVDGRHGGETGSAANGGDIKMKLFCLMTGTEKERTVGFIDKSLQSPQTLRAGPHLSSPMVPIRDIPGKDLLHGPSHSQHRRSFS